MAVQQQKLGMVVWGKAELWKEWEQAQGRGRRGEELAAWRRCAKATPC